MQHDEVIWQLVNQGFCSFKTKLEDDTFCKNPYNVSNLCRRGACPLANSNYATVREDKGVVYLFIKVIERAHSPKNMWERIKLSNSYPRALEQIDQHLEYWPKYLRHKCKQRLTKLVQMLHRMRKLAMKARPRLVRIHKKTEVREASREAKAERAANIEKHIQKELVARLEDGVYGNLYNFEREEEAIPEEEREMEPEFEFVESLPEGDFGEDIEDLGGDLSWAGSEESDSEEEGAVAVGGKRPKRRRGVEVELEEEREWLRQKV